MDSWLWGSHFLAFPLMLIIFNTFCSSKEGTSFLGPPPSFMHQAISAPSISYYDYIIVGGGTAGCPLAATLSQNSAVLVLERGGSPYGNPNITYLSNFGKSLLDLSPTSPAQLFISEDGVVNSRARVLGGGTYINAGYYSRAPASYVASAGWDHELVGESYQWVEKAVVFEPAVEQWQSALRDGLVEAGLVPYNGFTYDHLNGTKIGGSIFDSEERRHTAADFILKYANPEGLTVLLYATVQKILFTTQGKKSPLARGVIFKDGFGNEHKAYLRKGLNNEVIVSAGTLGSPQLLMLSGIGPYDHLKAHNIPLVLDQPLVGQGMGDNPANVIYVPSPVPVEVSMAKATGIAPYNYIQALSGKDYIGGYNELSPNQIGEISAQDPDSRALRGGFIFEKVGGPLSRGYLRLVTTDPNDNPSVRFNYFDNPNDLQRCVYGLRVVANAVNSNAFAPFRYDNFSLPFLPNDTTSLELYCKQTVRTHWHYHGGCQVGKVVDSDYRVIGVGGLRVLDFSTFNVTPGTNPQATIMMLGRYVGMKILNERFDSLQQSGN